MPEFQFDGAADFFAMGGHAVFVWFSYLAFLLVVVWFVWQPSLERRRIIKLLRARGERQQQQPDANDSAQQQGAQQ